MRTAGELTFEAIAIALAIPVGTAKTRMRSALHKLRTTLGADVTQPESPPMNHPHDDLSPAERDQLAQELLELHFGCHEDPARLQARLDREPAVRELQQQVLAQAAVLEAAVQPQTPPLQLTPPATGRGHWLHSPLGRLLTAAAVAATTVLGFFVADHLAQSAHTRFRTEHLHLTTSAPKAVPAGAPWSFTVQTRDLDGNAVDGTITWEAQGPNGAVLATAQAATRDGAATIAMPADAQLQVPQRVLVTAQTATDRVQQMFALSTAAAGPLVHVSTDRPVYRPGEAIFVRALVLDRLTRLPVTQAPQLIATMVDGRGAPVAQSQSPTGNVGTSAFVLQVPAASAGGPHTIRVQAADGSFPTESAEVVVRSFQPPQLHKQIALDRSSYAPGARGAGTVTVTRLAAGGGGASGAKATAKLVVDGAEVWSEQQALDANGQATFAFTVPKDVERGAARFVATIDDGGIVETELKPFVVPTGKVLVQALPEGGALVAGVPNTVYFECTDPLGRPIDGQGEVVDARGRQVAKFRTVHQGRARLAFTPSREGSYSLRLAGHDEPFPLPPAQERGIALQLAGNDIRCRCAAATRRRGSRRRALAARRVLPRCAGRPDHAARHRRRRTAHHRRGVAATGRDRRAACHRVRPPSAAGRRTPAAAHRRRTARRRAGRQARGAEPW